MEFIFTCSNLYCSIDSLMNQFVKSNSTNKEMWLLYTALYIVFDTEIFIVILGISRIVHLPFSNKNEYSKIALNNRIIMKI